MTETEIKPVFMNAALTYQLGNQGKQLSVQTSFLRDDPIPEILDKMDTLRLVMNVQRAHGEIEQLRDDLAHEMRRIKNIEADYDDVIEKSHAEWQKMHPAEEYQLDTATQSTLLSLDSSLTVAKRKMEGTQDEITKREAIIAEAYNGANQRTDN